MGEHRGVAEPYIILGECVGEAIYDSPEDGDKAKGAHPKISPLAPKDARPDKEPDSN